MCPTNRRLREITDPSIRTGLSQYCQKIIDRFHPKCIIVYGSQARKTYTPSSDIDLIIISDTFKIPFISRIRSLLELNQTEFHIEALGYTIQEFEDMLSNFRVTALDAIYFGIPIYGEQYFQQLESIFKGYLSEGLKRLDQAWEIPV